MTTTWPENLRPGDSAWLVEDYVDVARHVEVTEINGSKIGIKNKWLSVESRQVFRNELAAMTAIRDRAAERVEAAKRELTSAKRRLSSAQARLNKAVQP